MRKRLLYFFCCLFLVALAAGCSVEYPTSDTAKDASPSALHVEAPTGYSFLFLSDTAKGEGGDYSQLKTMIDYAADTFPQIDFILHGGDVVNPTEGGTEWEEYLAAMEAVANIPTYVTWGELDDEYLPAYYTLPENGPADLLHHFYSFSYENAHFIFLDSAYMGLQRDEYVNWLRNDIASNGKTWNILVCHYPLYPAADLDNDVTRASAQRNIWDSVLTELDIDLVLSGHQRLYMRSKPAVGGAAAEEGPIYILTNSGSRYNTTVNDYDYIDVTYTDSSNFCYFNITDNVLTMTAYDQLLSQIDTMTLTKDTANTIETAPEESAQPETSPDEAVDTPGTTLEKGSTSLM